MARAVDRRDNVARFKPVDPTCLNDAWCRDDAWCIDVSRSAFMTMSWHNTVLQCLLIPLWFLLQPSLSQSSQCTFFCPSQDELGQALLTQPLAIPYQSDYSVFECVYVQGYPLHQYLMGICRYGEGISDPETHSCFYIKVLNVNFLPLSPFNIC